MKNIIFIVCLLFMIILSATVAGGQNVVNGFNNPALITPEEAFQRMLSDLSGKSGLVQEGLPAGEDQGRILRPLDLKLQPLGRFFTPLNRTITPLPGTLRPFGGRVFTPLDNRFTPLGGRR